MRRLSWLLPVLLLSACAKPEPQPAQPALWRIDGPQGETGFLFGTIHSLDRPARWRSAKVDSALGQSDRIVVEVANLADQTALQRILAEMSHSDGLPPLSRRVEPALRPSLAALLRKAGVSESHFDGMETWAAALALARAETDAQAAANGIDRAVLAAAGSRPVIELEGAAGQFSIFDTLPEKEQRDLLAEVLRDEGVIDDEGEDVAAAWRKGDMQAIEAETRTGLLADPELREALFTARNRAWTDRLAAMLARGEKPFVAVGAAHMAGPDGLAAMLSEKGYRVERVQ
jgi:uncharacterized protein YbaP (TraB family)